jgi:uncharacterized coiled-coil DUF342 family protein
MSVAQILEESKTFSLPELEALENSIRLERLRRVRATIPAEERRLLQFINEPMPHTQRWVVLTQKWQDEGVSDEERAELLAIVTEREGANAERVEAVRQLSELRGVPFRTLWTQLMGETPAPIVPAN